MKLFIIIRYNHKNNKIRHYNPMSKYNFFNFQKLR